MTGGAHLSAERGEGQRRRGWRRLPVREAASGQGATSTWPTGSTKKWPVGERKWRWAAAGAKTEAGPNTSNKPFQFFF
jgi:hypothetical protein